MRADEDDRRRTGDRRSLRLAGYFYFDVVAGLPAYFVTVPPRVKAGTLKRIFDKICSGVELGVTPHVSLADFAGELLHVSAQLFA